MGWTRWERWTWLRGLLEAGETMAEGWSETQAVGKQLRFEQAWFGREAGRESREGEGPGKLVWLIFPHW